MSSHGKKVRIPFCTPEQSHYVSSKGVKIYPVGTDSGKIVIAVDDNGKYHTYDSKPLIQTEVNDALEKTVKFYYDKLKKEENENSAPNT